MGRLAAVATTVFSVWLLVVMLQQPVVSQVTAKNVWNVENAINNCYGGLYKRI